MLNRYSEADAARFAHDPLALRAYTSRLLGQDDALVLHGGGNTSVKATVADFFGDPVEVLYIKGSGWDLATIEPAGFAPVRMETLRKLVRRERLSDADMVREQRAAMLVPDAPTPSVEALLHALIPYPWVDHTHADAVVTLTNSPAIGADPLLGEAEALGRVFGERVLVVPYVMPGFVLARDLFERLAGVDLARYDGMVLLHHGVFTWGDSARESYDRMIALVDRAERELAVRGAWDVVTRAEPEPFDALARARLRRAVGRAWGGAVFARSLRDPEAAAFATRPDAGAIATRGPVTPDHIIRTKQVPVVVAPGADPDPAVAGYAEAYRGYFARHARGERMLDVAPRWAVTPGQGLVAFGRTVGDADIVRDLVGHTVQCIARAEALGGWWALPEADLFAMEYWELEQAKLKKVASRPELGGQVALVTGAAHGIGRATVERLAAMGAAVVAVDRDPAVREGFPKGKVLGVVADVTDGAAVDAAVRSAVETFGGLDLLVSNAGSFPEAMPIEAQDDRSWAATLELNLTAHQKVLRAATPLLALGFDPAVVFVASKNVWAPGPGVAAYSVAKAGLTQLARVAALELAPRGVRVNVVHPDAVFDTGLWTADKIAQRAARYGLTPEQYKTRNLLGREIRSRDVANLVARLLSPELLATTGAQVPIDGGNDRCI